MIACHSLESGQQRCKIYMRHKSATLNQKQRGDLPESLNEKTVFNAVCFMVTFATMETIGVNDHDAPMSAPACVFIGGYLRVMPLPQHPAQPRSDRAKPSQTKQNSHAGRRRRRRQEEWGWMGGGGEGGGESACCFTAGCKGLDPGPRLCNLPPSAFQRSSSLPPPAPPAINTPGLCL